MFVCMSVCCYFISYNVPFAGPATAASPSEGDGGDNAAARAFNIEHHVGVPILLAFSRHDGTPE